VERAEAIGCTALVDDELSLTSVNRSRSDFADLENSSNAKGHFASPSSQTRPIEEIRVGDRVLARNPEVSDEERQGWEEPDWNHWLHLSLVMPKKDGSQLNIEMLRPEPWVLEQLSYVVAECHRSTNSKQPSKLPEGDNKSTTAQITIQPASASSAQLTPANATPPQLTLPPAGGSDVSAAGEGSHTPGNETSDDLQPLSPLRQIYREIGYTAALCVAANHELVALKLDMELPELGALGSAYITNIQPCPTIAPGEGQPVVSTFAHPPSESVLDVFFEGQDESIGVTENHWFWSVDRQRFLEIGKMHLGERVQTFHGDTKRIESKLPRPGSQIVYNLEVFGEHVYFVGELGSLVHNSCSETELLAQITREIGGSNFRGHNGLKWEILAAVDAGNTALASRMLQQLRGIGPIRSQQILDRLIPELSDLRTGAFHGALSDADLRHILYADGPKRGGHLWPARFDKTPFPKRWHTRKIDHAVTDIITDPSTQWYVQTGNGGVLTKKGDPAIWRAWEIRDGTRIRVAYEPATGKVRTSFPDLRDPIGDPVL
ncbi:MAG: EndoU domain-containing protein, partial [Planctomycetota bacterium]